MAKRSTVQNISKKEMERLRQTPGFYRDDLLSEQLKFFNVYQLADGRVLLHIEGEAEGVLYASLADLQAVLNISPNNQPTHMLNAYALPGESFVTQVLSLIDQLAIVLNISRQRLDHSVGSLETIEQIIQRIGNQRCLEPDIFIPLLAYVGQTMVLLRHGYWQMRLAKDSQTWEAWVINEYGWADPVAITLYQQLCGSDSANLQFVVFYPGTPTARVQIAPQQATKELLSQPGVMLDGELSNEQRGLEVYALPDGKILVRDGESSRVFESKAAFEEISL